MAVAAPPPTAFDHHLVASLASVRWDRRPHVDGCAVLVEVRAEIDEAVGLLTAFADKYAELMAGSSAQPIPDQKDRHHTDRYTDEEERKGEAQAQPERDRVRCERNPSAQASPAPQEHSGGDVDQRDHHKQRAEGDERLGTGAKRREQALATRRRIVDSAYQLFCEYGSSPTTVEMIASAAGVALQTIHYVFRTKGALLQEVVEVAAAGTHDPAPVMQRSPDRSLRT